MGWRDHGFEAAGTNRWLHPLFVAEFVYGSWYGGYYLYSSQHWHNAAYGYEAKPEPLQQFRSPEALWAYVELMQDDT